MFVIEDLTVLMLNCYYVLVHLKEVIHEYLLDTLRNIADIGANKTTEQHHAIIQSKLTRLQHAAYKKRHKTNENCVRNISSYSLDENETCVLSYGLEHSVTPEHIPTDDIEPSPESVLARQREPPLVAMRRCMRGLLSNLAQPLKSKVDNGVISCNGLYKEHSFRNCAYRSWGCQEGQSPCPS